MKDIQSFLRDKIVINQNELMTLSAGSPGAFISHLEFLDSIPKELFINFRSIPDKPIEALSIAREITENLDIEQQIWFINWLQLHFWIVYTDEIILKRLDKLRRHLKGFVQPRLAWEVALLDVFDFARH